MKLPSRQTRDTIQDIALRNNTIKNLSKHALMIHYHNNHAITDEEFEIYLKSRKNLIILQGIIPLTIALVAWIIGCFVIKQFETELELIVMGGLMCAMFIWFIVLAFCFCISMFTKSRKYLYQYDKWYEKRGGYVTDLHNIFSPDGWRNVSNANAIFECVCFIGVVLIIIALTVIHDNT